MIDDDASAADAMKLRAVRMLLSYNMLAHQEISLQDYGTTLALELDELGFDPNADENTPLVLLLSALAHVGVTLADTAASAVKRLTDDAEVTSGTILVGVLTALGGGLSDLEDN